MWANYYTDLLSFRIFNLRPCANLLVYEYTRETSYFITRLQYPWVVFIAVAPILSFLLPLFVLIPKASKWTPAITIPIAVLVIGSQWIAYMMVVIPEVTNPSDWTFPWIELGQFLAFRACALHAICPSLSYGFHRRSSPQKAYHHH